jgi:hypothetical protein
MKKWSLSVAGSVVAAVAIYWLTEPIKDFFKSEPPPPTVKSTPAQTPKPQKYPWDGRVIDKVKDQLLANVDVSLAILKNTYSQRSDSEGRYIFIVDESVEPFVAVLSAAAQGYQPFTRQLTLDFNGRLERQSEIRLTPVPPAPTIANPKLPIPMLMQRAAAIPYRPRSVEAAVQVDLPPRGRGGR